MPRSVQKNQELQRFPRRFVGMDKLTGLMELQPFLDRVEDEVRRAARFQRPLGLLVVSWARQQEFQEYHRWTSKGYGILRQLARVMKANMRDIDVGGRVDGEILAAVLPETDLAGTRVVAERLARDAGANPYTGESLDELIRLSVNVGYVAMPEHGHDPPDLLGQARWALEIAQLAGFNKAQQGEIEPSAIPGETAVLPKLDEPEVEV